MPIIACGINHKSAPVALREKVVFPAEKLPLYLQDLAASQNIHEAVLLSTCNRSELYCNTDHPEQLFNWFCEQHAVDTALLKPVFYLHEGADAVQHIIEVACGLDSMVLGESQILGQLKTAFSESCATGMVGPLFNRLFQQVFSVAKEIRTNTAIGACPVSVSSAAVRFVREKYGQDIHKANVVLIGAGLTIDLVLRHLMPLAPKQVIVASRSDTSASLLAEKYQTHAIKLNQLKNVLPDVDIIISATGSTHPIVTADMVHHRNKSLFIVDIAVPRDVEPAVAELNDIAVYSIDDLYDIMQQNLTHREHAAEKAREVIVARTQDFIEWQQSIDLVTHTIRAWRAKMEMLCQTELSKSSQKLQRGDDPEVVMQAFARALMQKILHTPSVQLREAGFSGRTDLLQLAHELFALPERIDLP
ncbi:MAG: glutamyl-tRNA reductase [Gammaproteobacteria bacterium]|nr:glutamyl-tRNA reductase [Gammaproteobacteria bacterium]